MAVTTTIANPRLSRKKKAASNKSLASDSAAIPAKRTAPDDHPGPFLFHTVPCATYFFSSLISIQNPMPPSTLKSETYAFTPMLGWSLSRYEVFDKCKRQYYYTYYSKFVTEVPHYKISQLRELTTVSLEIGNVVHDVMEAFLRRLQKDDSSIDQQRFFDYAHQKAKTYFSTKTFIEEYYSLSNVNVDEACARIDTCLANFMKSPCCSWLYMKAMTNRENWMIEPSGYGETRLNGLKAYCKMDFLFPVDDIIYILDWKTGKKDAYKHSRQLVGYAAAASSNFSIPAETIFPKIVYLYPEFEEFEIAFKPADIDAFCQTVKAQTDEMLSYCADPAQNVPRAIDAFPKTPSPALCNYCDFRELCFAGIKGPIGDVEFDDADHLIPH